MWWLISLGAWGMLAHLCLLFPLHRVLSRPGGLTEKHPRLGAEGSQLLWERHPRTPRTRGWRSLPDSLTLGAELPQGLCPILSSRDDPRAADRPELADWFFPGSNALLVSETLWLSASP